DCCVGLIRDANVFCGDSGAAPCIIGSEVCGPALTITLEWEAIDSELDLVVTE
ncbi:unnamed protein product, partial [Ascophyllum nodosum]